LTGRAFLIFFRRQLGEKFSIEAAKLCKSLQNPDYDLAMLL